MPDERLGEGIVLIVVARAMQQCSGAPCRDLPAHMQPTRIVWKERLPIGPNGKLDRAALKAELDEPIGPIHPASPPTLAGG